MAIVVIGVLTEARVDDWFIVVDPGVVDETDLEKKLLLKAIV